MCSDQAIKGIARPSERLRRIEPSARWRLIYTPARIVPQIVHDSASRQLDLAALDQKRQLEKGCWGDGERTEGGQTRHALVPRLEPEQRVGIEQDHLRFRFPSCAENVTDPGDQSQDQAPAATLGSSIVSLGFAGRVFFAGTARFTMNFTPLRSITTSSPVSTSSRTSARCWRAWATV